MTSILVVDDEAYRTRAYRDNLERAGFRVVHCTTIDEASGVLYDPDQKFGLLIQDLQMGRPLPDDKLTMTNAEWEKYNRLAGLWFLVKHRDLLLSRKIPVAILTQRTPDEFTSIMNESIEKRGLPLKVFRKIETSATQLPPLVKGFLDEVGRKSWGAKVSSIPS